MTLRDKICGAGVNTLREFLCIETGIPGDTILYGTEYIFEEPEGAIMVEEIQVVNIEEPIQIVEADEDKIQLDDSNVIVVESEDIIDGIC